MRYLLLIFFILSFPFSVLGTNPNNKFGIHLAQPNNDQFIKVKELVNSNGGDWGYVTLVVQENDRDKKKWQDIFDQLRQNHLIPIIRLATIPVGENWRRPEAKDAQNWVDFLDSLHWVVKNRYIVLFNEPNHGKEWGGEVDIKNYTETSLEFAKKLKEKNKDFFVMFAGFDASAPSIMPSMEDEEMFIEKLTSFKNSFTYIDGWSSHSYPNPGFSGSPLSAGRGTIRTYEWELEKLRELGVTKELPVFITETGWRLGNEKTIAGNFQIAFDQIWSPDNRVVAVTPFVFDYQGEPFLEFSWKKFNSQEYYQQYYSVQSMSKIKGEPEQIQKGWINFKLPTDLVVKSTYRFKVRLDNLGQAIWDGDDNYKLKIESKDLKETKYLFDDFKKTYPFEGKDVHFTLKTNEDLGIKKIKFLLQKNNKIILESEDWNINILPLPTLKFETSIFPFGKGGGDNYEIQVFDVDDRLVFKKKNLSVSNGIGELKNIQNIALDELYRVVILKPYHLPRQEFIVFKKDITEIKFKFLLPLDLNNDGAFNFSDILSLFNNPH